MQASGYTDADAVVDGTRTKNNIYPPHPTSYVGGHNSAEGVIAPAGAKVTGDTIRMWLFLSSA